MLETHGLTHIALKVADLERSSRFYRQLFGATEMYHEDTFIQLTTPGAHDIIVLEKGKPNPQTGGLLHFGFRLKYKTDAPALIEEVEAAGGTVKEAGEFVPGEPYIFFLDPDGYEAEIWYERVPE